MKHFCKTNIFISVGLMVAVAAIFYTFWGYVLALHHDNSYFILSYNFAADQILKIGGLSNFLASLAGWNIAAEAILIGFTSAYIYYVLASAGEKLSKQHDPFFAALIPPALLIIQYSKITFLALICSALILAVLFHVLILIKGVKRKIIAAPILIAIAYLTVSLSGDLLSLVVYCGIYLLYSFFVQKFVSKFKYATYICLPITILIIIYNNYKEYNPRLRYVIEMEQMVCNEEWENVLKHAHNRLVFNKQTCYYTNIALYKTGNFSKNLFFYPQISGADGLDMETVEMRLSDMVYDIIGVPAEGLHRTFENYVRSGKNFYNIPKLIYYYDKVGKPELANRFATMLPHHKRIKPEGYITTGADSTFVESKLIGTLEVVCHADSANMVAFEYLMAHYALSGRIVKFVENISRASTHFNGNLPTYYQEAILLYKDAVPQDQQIAINVKISEEIVAKYNLYKEQMRGRGVSSSEFGQTYWFYMRYINPEKNKIYMN